MIVLRAKAIQKKSTRCELPKRKPSPEFRHGDGSDLIRGPGESVGASGEETVSR
jgi:hypothetical protein